MLAVLLGVVAMVISDATREFRDIAQNRGNAKLAAWLAPCTTLAGWLVLIFGPAMVIKHGLTVHGAIVLGAILVTDYVDGYVFTVLGRRIKP